MISVIINNYNYGDFIRECILSVLNQTYTNFQLIIVDDGSKDDSVNIIESFADKRILLIKKDNGGQLSCFNAALPYIEGDIVTFLDSDDLYKDTYLEKVYSMYEKHDIDFAFVNYDTFGKINRDNFLYDYSIHFPSLRLLTYKYRCWIGAPTSTLSMKRSILQKILPLNDIEEEWKTRADDILIWGASLHGAKKFYLCKSLIKYRVHGTNNYYNKKMTSDDLMRRDQVVNNFFSKYKHVGDDLTFHAVLNEMFQSQISFRAYLPWCLNTVPIIRSLLRSSFRKTVCFGNVVI